MPIIEKMKTLDDEQLDEITTITNGMTKNKDYGGCVLIFASVSVPVNLLIKNFTNKFTNTALCIII